MLAKAKPYAKENKISLCFLLAVTAFYVFFGIYDGPTICGDTGSYISMSMSREPLYCLWLAFFRTICGGGDVYLYVAVFFQNLFLAVAAWSLAEYIRKEFSLKYGWEALMLLVVMATSLITRCLTLMYAMYSNTILTEALAIPMFLLCIRYSIDYVFNRRIYALVMDCIVVFLNISSRKAMYICLAGLVVAVVLAFTLRKKLVKGLLMALVLSIVILGCVKSFDRCYNYALRGVWSTHTGDAKFIATLLLFTTDHADVQYIEDEVLAELFLEIQDKGEEYECLEDDSITGWFARANYYNNSFDLVTYSCLNAVVGAYAEDIYEEGSIEYKQLVDEIETALIAALLSHHIMDCVEVVYDNFLCGLVTSVAKMHRVLVWYAFGIYAIYIAAMAHIGRISWKKKKEQGDEWCAVSEFRTFCFAAFALFMIIMNIGLTAVFSISQGRYLIYSMIVFYIALILMGTYYLGLIKEKLKR